MPQLQLPFFPDGVTAINAHLGFTNKEGTLTYVYGHMQIFQHPLDDMQSFRAILSQIYVSGAAKQSELSKAFGVSKVSLKRMVKVLRDKGPAGFYQESKRRGAAVLTPDVLEKAQLLLNTGIKLSQVAEQLDIKYNTLSKALAAGRLHQATQVPQLTESDATTKSSRDLVDSLAPIGMGATNTLDRVAASLGKLNGVALNFVTALDVPCGGVLLALPALLACGLLSCTERFFSFNPKYYRLDSIFLLLAFIALARLKNIEALRYVPPGEWGKLLGLDRIPEVKTLCEKIQGLSMNGQPSAWAAELCQQWMKANPEAAFHFYIDGHVRVYHGEQTLLPKHHVARQKLCLRATTDYWVNAMDGQPFCVVNQAVDPGLIKVIEGEIIPRLDASMVNILGQNADPTRPRFVIIFDREGYSPDFFQRMLFLNIACLTYHKYPQADWPVEEFTQHDVTLISGETVTMLLAERGTLLSNKLWVREIRKLTTTGHQTAILSTDYHQICAKLAAAMFARWSQENFFKYMIEQFNLDSLVDYSMEAIPDATPLINPEYRRLDGEVRKHVGKLNRQQAEFGELSLIQTIEPKEVETYQQKKADLKERIDGLKQNIDALKQQRKEVKKHITFAELPQEHRFDRLSVQSKYLVDTIKMIAYRAETAMANSLRETLSHPDEARRLLSAIYKTTADLIPDKENRLLTVRLHHLANQKSSVAINNLCEELNATETFFPGTDLRLQYQLVA